MTFFENADIITHPEIAPHMVAPHAAILFSEDAASLIFANEEGLKLAGSKSLEKAQRDGRMPSAAIMRQIKAAASSLTSTGEGITAAIRARSTFRTRLIQVTLSRLGLSDGTMGILLVSEALAGRGFDRADARKKALLALDHHPGLIGFADSNGSLLTKNPRAAFEPQEDVLRQAIAQEGATVPLSNSPDGLKAVRTGAEEYLLLAAEPSDAGDADKIEAEHPPATHVHGAGDPDDDEPPVAVGASPMVGAFSSRRSGPPGGAGRWYYRASAFQKEHEAPTAEPVEPAAATLDTEPDGVAEDHVTPAAVEVAEETTVKAVEPTPPVTPAAPDIPAAAKPTTELGAPDDTFQFEAGSKPVRFVWEMNADSIFTSVSDEFGKAVGPENAQIIGHSWDDVCARYRLDTGDMIADLLKQQNTWSGRTVLWPVQDTDLRVPVDLAGLPTYGKARDFSGFNGFGIIRMADVMVDDRDDETETPVEAADAVSVEPLEEAPEPGSDTAAATGIAATAAVATLASAFAPGRKPALERPAEAAGDAKARHLSNEEQDAFVEIGEKLGSPERTAEESPAIEAETEKPAPDKAITPAGFVPSAFAPKPRQVQDANVDTSILARLPIPVLVYRDDDLLFANEEFHTLTGYRSLAQLAAMGGVDALFSDAVESDSMGPVGASIVNVDGKPLAVQANLQMVPWDSRRAMLLTLRDDPRDGDEYEPERQGIASEPAAPTPNPSEPGGAPKGVRAFSVLAGGASLGSAQRQRQGALSVLKDEEHEAPLLQEFSDLKSDDLRSILDTATDGVVVIGPDASIRAMNGSAEALFDVEAAEMTGRPFAALVAPESRGATQRHFERLSGSAVDRLMHDGIQIVGQTARGGLVPLFMTLGRTSDPALRCAVLRDVTPWQRTEKELVAARQLAEDASAEKSEFLARISHEVRTPLNAIIGFSDIMIDERYGPIDNDRYRGYLRDIQRSGKHILDLINDLLDISRIEAGKMELDLEPCELNTIVSETVALSQPQANTEQVIIRTSLSGAVPLVVADKRSLRQIILNLVSNSIKFTRPGGQVIVSTVYDERGEVALRVRDTGVGMDDGQIEAALRPFSQVATVPGRKQEGSGLGLPLTKATAEANGAKFHIESEPDAGTLVEIRFPAESVRLRD